MIELFIASVIAGAITAAYGTKAAVNAATDFVHARRGTKRAPRERSGWSKYWNQVWEDAAAKHGEKARQRAAKAARRDDRGHIGVGEWLMDIAAQNRRKAFAKRGFETDAAIADLAREYFDRMERLGLTPKFTDPRTAGPGPTVPTAPRPAEPGVTPPPWDFSARPETTPDPTAPQPGGVDADSAPPKPSLESDLFDANALVNNLKQQLQQTELELAEANRKLEEAAAEAEKQRADGANEGLVKGQAETEEAIADARRQAEAVAQRLREDRDRYAGELAEAELKLDAIAAAWRARPEAEHDPEAPQHDDGFTGTVVDGEVVPEGGPRQTLALDERSVIDGEVVPDTTTLSGATAAPEANTNHTNGMEHHMSGEVTGIEQNLPFVKGMGGLASEAGPVIEAAAANLATLNELSEALEAAINQTEEAIASLRQRQVGEEFIAGLVQARENFSTAKTNLDVVVATAPNLAAAGEVLGVASSVFDGLEQEIGDHINTRDKVSASTTGDFAYMGINRE
jgi:hypothetical protein